ncbi:MAG: type II toxin-antitoxin system VapB family antitoxin, partial [Nakamurella sp.]
IKSERAHTLARQVAARTGMSQTSAIEQALTDMLARLEGAQAEQRASVGRILADVDARMAGQPALSTADLYDAAGMPA